MIIRTVCGYDFFEVSSAMQKAIRRADTGVAGFFALELWASGYRDYVWKRLFTISAEDCYGIITKEIEALWQGHELVNKTATGCRLHNVYSPNPRERTLLWFLLNEERVSLYNCGQNIRSFTYMDDAVEGLIYAIGCNRQLINICNVQPVTTMYFATLVKYYKSLEIELINEKRDFDNLEQSVNRDIYLVPLSYTSVEDGVKKIFDERKGKDISY